MTGLPYRLGRASGERAWYACRDDDAPRPFPARSGIAWSSPAMEWEWIRGFLDGWDCAKGGDNGNP